MSLTHGYRLGKSSEVEECDAIVSVCSGDREAFETLVRRYLPAVEGLLAGKIAHSEEREDLTQEIFLRAYLNLSKLRNPARFGPWLMRIARNQAYDSLRRKRLETQQRVPVGAEDSTEKQPSPSFGPGENAAANQLIDTLQETLGALSDKLRPVVYLSLQENMTAKEIADLLGLRGSTVRMRLKHGLAKVRKDLRRRGFGPDIKE